VKTTFEINVSEGRITNAQVMPNGSLKIDVDLNLDSKPWPVRKESIFIKIPASQLSMNDYFMQYIPRTPKEKAFKNQVEQVIKSGLRDFWRPIYDPSFTDDGEGIRYEPGMWPAIGKSYVWWKKAAKNFLPKRGSRLGTRSEYIAFLATLIKVLVNTGESVEWAWNAVCNDSRELGYYWDLQNANHHFESTGSRCVCGFYDLGNTYKVLAEDIENEGFFVAGGAYDYGSERYPLSDMELDLEYIYPCDEGVGWIVLSD